MTDSDPPWEPPRARTQSEHLVGARDRLRTTRIGASSLALGGPLKHLAVAEDHVFTTRLRGEPPGRHGTGPTGRAATTGRSFSAASDTPDQLCALWDGAVERSRARLDAAASGRMARIDETISRS